MQPQVPDYIKDMPKSAADEAVMDSRPNRLQPSGRQFIYKAHGEELLIGATAEIIILAITPDQNWTDHRVYYESNYDPSKSGPPDCASHLGDVPFDWIVEPQNTKCKDCKQAVWGSGGTAKSQACSSFKLIYAVFPDKLDEVFQLKVSTTALKLLRNYRKLLQDSGKPLAGTVTEVFFDPTELQYGKVAFKWLRYVTEAQAIVAGKLSMLDNLEKLAAPEPLEALPAPPVVATEPEVTPPAAPAVKTEPEVIPPATASPLELLNVMLPAVEPVLSKFDAMLAAVNKCLDTQALSDYLNSIAQDLKTITKDQMDTLRESVTQKQSDLLNVLTASNPSELPGVLEGILKKADPQQHLAAFIELTNKVTGVVFDAALHGVSGNKFPALTQAGQYKKSKTRKDTTEVATPATVENLLKNLNKL